MIDIGPKPPTDRVYLGDGLFAEYDGYQIMLAANDGIRDYAKVYLEPMVFDAFLDYARRVGMLKSERSEGGDDGD